MPKVKAKVGTRFFKEGTQNQKILAKFWGNGKSFTADDLRDKLDIASPGARLSELREEGFDVRAVAVEDGCVGRHTNKYTIAKRRVLA
ncbi:uncharacterized protein METZ01_LOCUS420490 [marine metagenome]|jgi:predicted ArsR family transcriptional regulator|uniref:Winged helix-turn-helix domain-containing protein n=1 Tax=marine metagenome TaxID=408172 RepID=A0A382X8X4_9ZZZZ|tara:strand:+ start:587 stop:850 length:264 start_codon:yes stop_codon:yes gene_type:complete